MQYVHGGDVYSYAEAHSGAMPVDLSANINPFGMPETVRQAVCEAVNACICYPDPFCRAARRAIGTREGVPPDWLYCGNGAADVLDRLAAVLKPRTALLTAPTFAEYERTLAGCKIRFHTLRAEDDFLVTERILSDLTPELDAVYLCNPNNPTGRTIAPALLKEMVRQCTANGTWIVVDECFNDFLIDGEQHMLKSSLADHPKLVLLHAYTKMYAVPGVRFGWCMTSNGGLIDALYRAGQPWNVSVIAQRCAEAAARERGFARDTVRRIAEERRFLKNALQARGLTVYAGEANFLLFRSLDTKLHEKLKQRGILVRDCSNYRGLGKGYCRTAVRTRRESEALLSALDACGKEGY